MNTKLIPKKKFMGLITAQSLIQDQDYRIVNCTNKEPNDTKTASKVPNT
jgi:hypothetical protein